MITTLAIIIFGLVCLMILERIYPDQKLKEVDGWWNWVIFINMYQLIIVLLAIYTWESWFQIPSLLNLGEYLTPFQGGLLAYIINTWIFYWWHRGRHEIYFLWITCHQLHHSAQRIEAITSFYKHPVEILVDSIMMAALLYIVLGLKTSSSIWLSGFSAFGEYFYHMNIKTPHWVGYIFQRPESHRIHHFRNKIVNSYNYSDLPIWDILAGTFYNPKKMDHPTGFTTENEIKRFDMLLCKDVIQKNNSIKLKSIIYQLLVAILLFIGCLNTIGFLLSSPQIRGLAFSTAASPLPLVFTKYNGVETFSTTFMADLYTTNNTKITIPIDYDIYSQIKGPYNRRNIFGAIFSHGPFFQTKELLELRNQILSYVICKNSLNFKLNDLQIKNATIIIKSKIHSNNTWQMNVTC